MLNKENYVPWSSRLLRYAKNRPNGKLIYNSIVNGMYVRQLIPEPGDQNCEVPVNETFHEQTDDELTEKELKQAEADDQDIYYSSRIANQNSSGNGNVLAEQAESNATGNNADLDEIEEVNANFILMANLQQASTSGTQSNKALVYDSDGSVEVSEQKDTTKGMSVNTQFCKQSILGKPPSSSGSKLYAVTPFSKYKGLPKIDETHALSKPVTSNSVSTLQESNVVKNNNVIVPGMFRFNPFKPSREEKSMPNKVRAIVRTKPITVS
nr:hypothetical protein [Tanacetum cinerariifolium]